MDTGADAEGNLGPDSSADEEVGDTTYHHSPFVRELRRLKTLQNYQRRGYDFQDFIGSLFKHRHFSVVPSPGTARPRQTDLLATRGTDVYLIETKWRSSKANIDDIDALFSRLESAPATVLGLMVSYVGFTQEAVRKVELRSDRPVILVNGDELERLVEWGDDVAQLLGRKKNALLTHRKAFFGETRRSRPSAKKGKLAVAPAVFAFPDGTRTKWFAGDGTFGEFTFVQELPDVDWVPSEGRSVTLDMAVPIYDERGVVTLLHHLSGMGWATESARWSIQQSATNWLGMGASAFAEALQDWRKRYKGIDIHHSEEFCYFDICDGGFYTLTAKISAYDDRSIEYVVLSFQLTGIPLNTDSLKELSSTFDVGEPCYFRPMNGESVVRKWHLREPYCVPLEPIAFIAEPDNVFDDKREWARGLVARNPFYRPRSPLKDRVPDWMPAQVFESELLICDLRSWHPLSEPRPRYVLWGCESARTADAVIVRPIAEWPDRDHGHAEVKPSRLRTQEPDRSPIVEVEGTVYPAPPRRQ